MKITIKNFKPIIIFSAATGILLIAGCRTAWDDGYMLGKADSAKASYNYLQKLSDSEYANNKDEPEFRTYSFPGPEEVDGVKFAPHTMTVRTVDIR